MTNDDAFMALAGVRYCLGRHTYAPSICCDWLQQRWASFKEADRAQILREIKEHIKEDEARDHEPVFAIDTQTWRLFVAWEASQPTRQENKGEDRDGQG